MDLSLCGGQGYDNAPNMSRNFKGVQALIREKNPQAYYSPCSAHYLHLCGVHVMEVNVQVKTFLRGVQKLYNLSALSPGR